MLKAVTARYVMEREGVAEVYQGQRDLLQELVAALVAAGPADIEPWLRPSAEAAGSDDELLRVVVDQVASLTDVSVVEWHRHHCASLP